MGEVCPVILLMSSRVAVSAGVSSYCSIGQGEGCNRGWYSTVAPTSVLSHIYMHTEPLDDRTAGMTAPLAQHHTRRTYIVKIHPCMHRGIHASSIHPSILRHQQAYIDVCTCTQTYTHTECRHMYISTSVLSCIHACIIMHSYMQKDIHVISRTPGYNLLKLTPSFSPTNMGY